jgi:cytoskeleton protein RodZ
MGIGGELRAARQARSLSVEDIARVTKVSPRVLRAIESDTLDDVPRGPFMRGYLRAFAQEVGLDGDDLARRYREEFEPPPPPSAPIAPQSLATDAAFDPNDASIGSSPSHLLQIAVIAVVAVAYLISQRQPDRLGRGGDVVADAVYAAGTLPEGRVHAVATTAAAASSDVPVGTGGSRDTKRPERLAIEVRAEGTCWVEAAVDGERAIARLMNAGERQTMTATDGVVLRIGDPAAFAFAINGVAGRALGPAGQPVTVRIDASNYRQFLIE